MKRMSRHQARLGLVALGVAALSVAAAAPAIADESPTSSPPRSLIASSSAVATSVSTPASSAAPSPSSEGPSGYFPPSKQDPSGFFPPSEDGPPGFLPPSEGGPSGFFPPSEEGPPGLFPPSSGSSTVAPTSTTSVLGEVFTEAPVPHTSKTPDPGTTTVGPSALPTAVEGFNATSAESGPTLPFTGFEAGGIALAGLVLVGGGATAIVVARRRLRGLG